MIKTISLEELEAYMTRDERDMTKPLIVSPCGRMRSWIGLKDGAKWFNRDTDVLDQEFREFISTAWDENV